jgi:dTDP-glucose 4,6-dehydratase
MITGGAGFIGSNFVHHCRKNRPDWDLHVVDSLTYAGNLDNLSQFLTSSSDSVSCESRGSIRFTRLDICDRLGLASLLESSASNDRPIDTIIHFAAESHVDRSIHSAEPFIRTNVLGTESLLSVARQHEVRHFVHISTDEVYGSLGPTGLFYEDTPLDPTSPYAASKASSDLVALAYAKTYGLDVSVTRCTNNYGPYQFPEKFIPLCILNAIAGNPIPLYGDGLNVRSWLHVDDHCEAIVAVAEQGKAGEVYNIGSSSDGELTNLEVVTKILKYLGRSEGLIQKVTDRAAHDRRYAVDTSKIKNKLGWTPRYSFDSGLIETINWYVENDNWCTRVLEGDYKSFYAQHYSTLAKPLDGRER